MQENPNFLVSDKMDFKEDDESTATTEELSNSEYTQESQITQHTPTPIILSDLWTYTNPSSSNSSSENLTSVMIDLLTRSSK